VGVHVVRGALIKAALWGCIVVASVSLSYLYGPWWGLLAWAVLTAVFLVFVVDAGGQAVDTPARRPPAEVTWDEQRRRAG
jgi:hypothetical protein